MIWSSQSETHSVPAPLRPELLVPGIICDLSSFRTMGWSIEQEPRRLDQANIHCYMDNWALLEQVFSEEFTNAEVAGQSPFDCEVAACEAARKCFASALTHGNYIVTGTAFTSPLNRSAYSDSEARLKVRKEGTKNRKQKNIATADERRMSRTKIVTSHVDDFAGMSDSSSDTIVPDEEVDQPNQASDTVSTRSGAPTRKRKAPSTMVVGESSSKRSKVDKDTLSSSQSTMEDAESCSQLIDSQSLFTLEDTHIDGPHIDEFVRFLFELE